MAMNRSESKKVMFKVNIVISLIFVIEIILMTVEPTITAQLSTVAQLDNSNSSFALYRLYDNVLQYRFLFYLLFTVLMFQKNIKRYFIKL